MPHLAMPARGVAFQPPAASAMQPRCQQHAAPPPPQPQQRQQQQPAAALQPQRRLVLGGLLGSLAALQPASAWAEEAATLTAQGVAPKPSSLAARIATQGNVQQPGIQPPWAPKQIFYPRYLFGEWEVRRAARVQRLSMPLARALCFSVCFERLALHSCLPACLYAASQCVLPLYPWPGGDGVHRAAHPAGPAVCAARLPAGKPAGICCG